MHRFFGSFYTGRAALGMLIIRLFFGWGLVLHGYQKFTHGGPFHWGDALGIPSFWQSLAFLGEFAGGLGLMVGLLTPLAALGITITMVVAFLKVHLPAHEVYVHMEGGPNYEVAAHYLIVGVGALISGPGALSLDALIFGRRPRGTPYAP